MVGFLVRLLDLWLNRWPSQCHRHAICIKSEAAGSAEVRTTISSPYPQPQSVARFFDKVRETQRRGSLAFSVEEDNAMETLVFLAAMAMTSGLLFVYDRM